MGGGPADLGDAFRIAIVAAKSPRLDRLGHRRADDAVGVALRISLKLLGVVVRVVALRPRRHEEQPIVLRMLEAEADVGHPQLDQPLDRVGDRRQPQEARAERADVLGHQLAQQRLLVGEVVVDRRCGALQSLGDRPHRGRLNAALHEQLPRHIEDAIVGGFAFAGATGLGGHTVSLTTLNAPSKPRSPFTVHRSPPSA
jgi:hypothetical protein